MIKSELVRRIARQNPHLYQRDVENILNAVLGEVVSAWHEAIALSCAASELFPSRFAKRERPAIPEPALSCLCRRKHSQFLGLPKKFASGSTRASQINGKSHHLGPPAAHDILRTESKLSQPVADPDHHQLSAIAHSSPD
jgi:hypothetical protein